MWIVEDVRVEEYSSMKTEDKAFSSKNKWEMYGVTFARKHGSGEMEKQGGERWQGYSVQSVEERMQ